MTLRRALFDGALGGIASAVLVAGFQVGQAHAAEIEIASQGPVVELSIAKSVVAEPDMGIISTGVTARAQTVAEAMKANAATMNTMIARLKGIGIERRDIQTSNFSLNPQYVYENNGAQPRFIGYDVNNTVSVNVRDLERMPGVIDTMARAGATNFNGPSFMLEKDEVQKASARKAAFDEAGAMALNYARMAGYAGVRLLEVSEAVQQRPVYSGNEIIVTAVAKQDATPIEPGAVNVAVTITAKYEMAR